MSNLTIPPVTPQSNLTKYFGQFDNSLIELNSIQALEPWNDDSSTMVHLYADTIFVYKLDTTTILRKLKAYNVSTWYWLAFRSNRGGIVWIDSTMIQAISPQGPLAQILVESGDPIIVKHSYADVLQKLQRKILIQNTIPRELT